MIGSKPTFLTVAATNGSPMRFLIMDAPHQSNLHLYIRECRRHQVTDLVRVCEPTYVATGLEAAGISLHEMPYPDGHSPPKEVLDQWLTLVDYTFFDNNLSKKKIPIAAASGSSGLSHSMVNHPAVMDNTPSSPGNIKQSPSADGVGVVTEPCIAVHCVAGLGRAPVLVAIALIEFANMDPVDAVTLIRKHRRGAINEKQLSWLEQYRKSYRRAGQAACVIQ
jgi:protein tyrosine phosphatase type 4A